VPSTASEWLAESSGALAEFEDMLVESGLPLGVLTEYPDWMKQTVADRLVESFEQPYWDDIAQSFSGDAERWLQAGLRDGLSIRQMAKRMSQEFSGGSYKYAVTRAMNIARTEAGHALNAARKDGMNRLMTDVQAQLDPEMGDVMRPVWLSVLGNTTRDNHANLDGVPADKNGMWELAGYKIPWPGHISLPASERCNCQCTIGMDYGLQDDRAQQLIDDYYERAGKSSKHLQGRHNQLSHGRGGGGMSEGSSSRRLRNQIDRVDDISPKMEIQRGRSPDGAEEQINVLGRVDGYAKVTENKEWSYKYREEFSDAKPGAQVNPDEVDGRFEQLAVEAAVKESEAFWSSKDPDAHAIRKYDDAGPPTDAENVSAHMNTIFTANTKDAGAGSGGPHSARVFWTPYSIENRNQRLTNENGYDGYSKSLGVDPMYVLGHELHHAYGYHSELDLASDVVGVAAHIRSGRQHNPGVASGMVQNFCYTMMGSKQKRRKAIHAKAIRYLHHRFGGELDKLMTESPGAYSSSPTFSRDEWMTFRSSALENAEYRIPRYR